MKAPAFWWRKPGLAARALWPASLVYGAGAALHRALTRPVRAPVPVISVGNLIAGGAGKTPVVLAIAQRLAARGRRPLVLSRGYGRASRAPLEVSAGMRAAEAGDEPLLLARRGLRVAVGPRRAELLRFLGDADVVLLDDGLQHHGLARDLDVVVVDATVGHGNGLLLPAGPLREPVRALGRVRRGLTWATRAEAGAVVPQLGFPVVESRFEVTGDWRGRRVFLFAGIARPASFEATARAAGAEVVGTRWFADHHVFSEAELAALQGAAGGAELVTTEKDAMRVRFEVAFVRVDLRVTRGAEALDAALDEVLR